MVITICCEKGGTSKTTTAAIIAQALTYKEKRTLLIDLDAQKSASLVYGANEGGSGGSYSLIMGAAPAEALVQEVPAGMIIPASRQLNGLDVELSQTPERDFFLRNAIEPIRNKFDFIVCDTPPGLGTILVQALAAADIVIIPLLCDPQALQGLHQVTETIEEVKALCNPNLQIAAVVLTRYNKIANLTRQYEELIQEQCREMGLPLAETRIRKGIAIQEAQAVRANIYYYKKRSAPAKDYLALCEEIGLI